MGTIEDVVIGDKFQQLQNEFMDKYCMEFEDCEENKLQYTGIFQEYCQVIERLEIKLITIRDCIN